MNEDMKEDKSPFSWVAQYSETYEPDKHGRWARLLYYRGYFLAKVGKYKQNDVIYFTALGYFPAGSGVNPQLAEVYNTLDEAKSEVEKRFMKFISDCTQEEREETKPAKKGISVLWLGAFCIFNILAIEIVILYYVFLAIFENA